MARIGLDRPPGLAVSYAAALLPRRRREGLPDTEFVLPDVVVDREYLTRYQRVCGYPLSDRLPATYPQVLAFPLALRLMAGGDFPFPLPGLVQVRNRTEVRCPVGAGDPLTLRVWADSLAAHRRGSTVDLVTSVVVGGEEVCVARATYLRRGPAMEGAGAVGGSEPAPRPVEPDAFWTLRADLGRRYAAVSGDRNPIHLSRVSARPFGFRTAIVHGMWSAARCLAVLGTRLPRCHVADVSFLRPVAVPGRVGFGARRSGDSWDFAVSAPPGGRASTGPVLVAGRAGPG